MDRNGHHTQLWVPTLQDGSVAIYRSSDPRVAGCAEARLWGAVLGDPSSPGCSEPRQDSRVLLGPASAPPPSPVLRLAGVGQSQTRLISHFPGTAVHAAPATSCPPTAAFSGSRQKGQCGPCPSVLAGSARFRPVSPPRPLLSEEWLSIMLTVKDSSRECV